MPSATGVPPSAAAVDASLSSALFIPGLNQFKTATANWTGSNFDASQSLSCYIASNTTSGEQITFESNLKSGSWKANLKTMQNGNCGILTILVDGVSVSTLDCYAAALTYNLNWNFTFTLATSGIHTIQITSTTKNAASSGYRIFLTTLTVDRTGA